jgi:hypothetical protein
MSGNSKEFRQLELAILNILRGTPKIRSEVLDTQIQAYSLSPSVIFKEMLHNDSPFQWRNSEDEKLPRNKIRQIANIVSEDLYKVYKQVAAKHSPVKVTGGKLPPGFGDGNKIEIAFDDSKRLIYFSGKGKDNYESFRGALRKPVTDFLLSTRDPIDPTRIFVVPNQEWINYRDALTKPIRDERDNLKAATSDPQERKRIHKAFGSKISRIIGEAKKDVPVQERFEGLDAGHTFGASVFAASGLIEGGKNLKHLKEIKLLSIIPDKFRPELETVVNRIIENDASLRWERIFGKNKASGLFVLTVPEAAIRNKATGGATGEDVTRLKKIITEVKKSLPELKGSPSYNQLLTTYIQNLFLNKPIKSQTFKSSKKIKLRKTTSIPVSSLPGGRGKISSSRIKVQEENKPRGLKKLLIFLNARLHDKIRENMGKGGSRTILNYRTGRFAKSAKVLDLAPKGKTQLEAIVKYQKDPYSVFEKIGRLHKPGRDPAVIFGRSIRQILAEEKIANLSRVQVTLRG